MVAGKSSPPDPVQQFALLPGCSWFLEEHQERFIDLSHVYLSKLMIQTASLFKGGKKKLPIRLLKLDRRKYLSRNLNGGISHLKAWKWDCSHLGVL